MQTRSERENHYEPEQKRDEADELVRPVTDDSEPDQEKQGNPDVAAELRRTAEAVEEVGRRVEAELLVVSRHDELQKVQHEDVVRLHRPGHMLRAVKLDVERIRIEGERCECGESDSTNRVGQVRADGLAVQESEQDQRDERDEEAQRHLLFSRQELQARRCSEQQSQHVGRAALSNDDLVEQEQDERGIDREGHVGMPARVSEHERTEPVEQAADRCRLFAVHVALEDEVRAPRGEGKRKCDEDVVREDRSRKERHRREQERRNEHRRVPHEVEPVWIAQVVAEQRVVSPREGKRQPAQVPDEQRRIRVAPDPMVGRR